MISFRVAGTEFRKVLLKIRFCQIYFCKWYHLLRVMKIRRSEKCVKWQPFTFCAEVDLRGKRTQEVGSSKDVPYWLSLLNSIMRRERLFMCTYMHGNVIKKKAKVIRVLSYDVYWTNLKSLKVAINSFSGIVAWQVENVNDLSCNWKTTSHFWIGLI